MSKKTAISNTPTDTTPSYGLNYGLDGYDFDMDYGDGVREKAELPSVRGLSGIPDGVITGKPNLEKFPVGVVRASEGNFDLTEFLKDTPQVNNLDWLENIEQDPDRLPENPVNSIPELEEAWGRRTDGVHRLPYQTKEAIDQANPKAAKQGKTASEIQSVIRLAMRRSAYGAPLANILREAATALGRDAEKAKTAMQALKAEHGLVGKVHIRAAAFPGCASGKWKEEVRKFASTAKYIVAGDHCAGCIHAQNGRCAVFKKQIVVDVPWEQARKAYAPTLEATGRKVASVGDPKEALRVAFVSEPKLVKSSLGQMFPTINTKTGVSPEEAFRKLASMPAPVQEKVTLKDKQATEERKLAHLQIAKWHRAGLLPSREDATRLVTSSASPMSVLKAGAALVVAAKQSTYKGEGTAYHIDKTAARGKIFKDLEKATKILTARVETGAAEALGRMVKSGQLKDVEARKIAAMGLSPDKQMRLAAAVVAKRASTVAAIPQAKEAAVYTGAGERGLVPRVAPVRTATVSQKHIAEVVNQAKRWMNTGYAGHALDNLMKGSFSSGILKAASAEVKEAREAHEGMAGHIYVDASTFASPKGTKGCDAGALLHRARGTKFVLAMDRCAGCTAHNVEGRCQKYGKILTDSVPVADPQSFQKKQIKLANATDAERTASLFAPTGSQLLSEFGGLKNAAMEDIELDSAPTSERLGEIMFGGIDFGDDE